MLKRNIYLFIIFFLNFTFGQEIRIKGQVSDEKNFSIVGASVLIKNCYKNQTLGYCVSNDKGFFEVIFTNASVKKILIKASHINYEVFLDSIDVNSKTINYNIKLIGKSFEIKPVVINQKKIKDTIKIKLDSLKLTERSTLRDILEKTDGFVVSDDGGLTFRGKKINKVLINKKEVFINQNKIALDNLEYGIMSDVQLINNYKDKFNIDFDNFTSSVINVNTKSSFKGLLNTYGDIAYGYNDKYLLKLRSFLFSDQLNMFATSNTNNLGKKEFNFNDISNSFKVQSSDFFKENFNSFFDEDNLLRTSFNSNTSLTIRKEEAKSKLGFVLYYNNINQTKDIFQTTESNNNRLYKKESKTFMNKGNSIVSNFSYNKLLTEKAMISFFSDIIYTKVTNASSLKINNYLPTQNEISESNFNSPKTLISSTSLNFKLKLNEKLILSSHFDYNLENSENYFESNYKIINPEKLNQLYTFRNQSLSNFSMMDYKFNAYLSSSIGFKTTFINDKLIYKEGQNRKGISSETIMQLRGQKKKMEYSAEFKPQYFMFYNGSNHFRFNINSSASYKTNENSRFNVSFEKNSKLTDMVNSVDVLVLSFNNRLINTSSIIENISSLSNLSVGYNYSSIIKTQSFSLSYSNGLEKNYLQPIFLYQNNNVFYYTNKLIDNKKTSTYRVSFGKGFYFSKQYHLLRIKNSFSFSNNKFPLFLDKEYSYILNNITLNSSVGVELKKRFIDEVYFHFNASQQMSFLDKNHINTNKKIYLYSTIDKKTENFEFKLTVGQNFQKNQGFEFKTPIMHLEIVNKLNDKVSLFLKGRYLFHLFNFKNTDLTSLNVEPDGNFVYSNYNENNLNYLIIGLTYKF